MNDRVCDLEEAIAGIPDGAVLGVGGAGLSRKPMAALRALVERGVRDLELVTFVGSLDVELLVAAGAVRAVRSSHVSLGGAGRAKCFAAAVRSGTVEDREESEWMLLGGLRAAAAGLAFLPTRAGRGSDLARARGLREVEDPYTGVPLLAIPALHPDVALIHAWRADPAGNVQMAWPPDYLWDVDLLLARAARRVIVTVERLVGHDEVVRTAERTVLCSFEVASVVEIPSGAAPTASPPDYSADLSGISSDVAGTMDATSVGHHNKESF